MIGRVEDFFKARGGWWGGEGRRGGCCKDNIGQLVSPSSPSPAPTEALSCNPTAQTHTDALTPPGRCRHLGGRSTTPDPRPCRPQSHDSSVPAERGAGLKKKKKKGEMKTIMAIMIIAKQVGGGKAEQQKAEEELAAVLSLAK